MFFVTESGSTYEVDEANKRIRRLRGKVPATPRVGEGGAWKEYELLDLEVGRSALILWTSDIDPPPEEGSIPTTETSRVQEILDTLN